NGAGKSVTLKAVAGLVPAWEGDIRFEDRDIAGLAPEQRVEAGMGHVTQGRQVFPELTVEENLRIGAYFLRKRDKDRYRQVLDEMFARFPKLADRRDQPAGTMSGGEQAMLAVARALMNEPKLLLVDEPSAGLAPSIVSELMGLLRDVADSGVTILMVEQNISFALEVADRALIMQRGQIVHGGDVDRLDRDELARLLGIGRLLSRAVEGGDRARATNGRARQQVVIEHRGGGWYVLPDGSTVRGRQAAQEAAAELGGVVR
ncbi:MAG TPA: ABC transporter ATP-binding protein, partial [Nitriliruptorales bacterium]